jgi:S-DNA-T family DNA segregation ATPase FtsK/SpoIIIE
MGERRRKRRYRRAWADVCAAHRLSWAPHPKAAQNSKTRASYWDLLLHGQKGSCPKLVKIRTGDWMDELQVRMLPGQTPDEWDREVEGIAHSFEAREGRIRADKPGRIKVQLCYGDPLAVVINALAITPRTDLGVIPIGLYEDGATWFVRLQGSHVLVAGDTGSGKGSATGSIIRAVCPAIKAGMVQVVAVDPKGGMELRPYEPLLAGFAYRSFEEMVRLLESAVAAMQARAARLAGLTRTHFVTTDEPLVIVLIDELAALTAYAPDRKIRERVLQSLSLLLTQGRAVGFVTLSS